MKMLASLMTLAALVMTLGAGGQAYAAEEKYADVQRDVRVMTDVLKGAFRSDKICDECDGKIEGRYLANQGAVFTVRQNRSRGYVFSSHRGDMDFNFDFDVEFDGVEPTEIISKVRGIAPDVEVMTEDVNVHVTKVLEALDLGDAQHQIVIAGSGVASKDRQERRKLQDEQRALADALRARELEMIAAKPGADRDELESSLAALGKDLAAKEAELAEINARMQMQRVAARAERVAVREAKLEEREAAARQQQALVFQAFCDYGATLKNLPRDEHVTLIFTGTGADKGDAVFVLEKRQLDKCKGGDELQAAATSYNS